MPILFLLSNIGGFIPKEPTRSNVEAISSLYITTEQPVEIHMLSQSK